RKERQAETRARLLEAAEQVFLRRGLGGSSVEEIAAEAGFTRGAFYSNFKSKEEVFVELLHVRVYDRMARLAEESWSQPGGPRERLRWGVERLRGIDEEEEGAWLVRLWLEVVTRGTGGDGLRKRAPTCGSGHGALRTDGA